MSDTTTTRNSVNDAKISVRELSDLMVQRVPLVASSDWLSMLSERGTPSCGCHTAATSFAPAGPWRDL